MLRMARRRIYAYPYWPDNHTIADGNLDNASAIAILSSWVDWAANWDYPSNPVPQAANATVRSVESSAAPQQTAPNLSPKQHAILQFMFDNSAISNADKMTRKFIVEGMKKQWNRDVWAAEFASLSKLDLTESAKGSSGGVWLTARGIEICKNLPHK